MLDQSSSLESQAHTRLDRAILTLILDNGRPLSEAEIARAVDVPGHVPDSLKRLRRAGVIHRWNDLATPSHSAVRYHGIRQSNGHDSAGTEGQRSECVVLATLLRTADAEGPLTDERVRDALSARKRRPRARIDVALDRLDAAGLIERRGGQSIASEVAKYLDYLMTP
ncbi:MAG TPA: hypothetical protein VMF09_09415 [Solirubrobacteraceae bacterium]|nr:hypothetical protein [Solirubrobacteraceae bacterium]